MTSASDWHGNGPTPGSTPSSRPWLATSAAMPRTTLSGRRGSRQASRPRGLPTWPRSPKNRGWNRAARTWSLPMQPSPPGASAAVLSSSRILPAALASANSVGSTRCSGRVRCRCGPSAPATSRAIATCHGGRRTSPSSFRLLRPPVRVWNAPGGSSRAAALPKNVLRLSLNRPSPAATRRRPFRSVHSPGSRRAWAAAEPWCCRSRRAYRCPATNSCGLCSHWSRARRQWRSTNRERSAT